MQIGDYALRPIQEEDLRQLLEWRNSPRIRNMMLTNHIITWEEHKAWYDRIKNENPLCHLAFTYQGKLAGYIGFNDYDPKKKEACPGIYLGDKNGVPVDAGICQMYLSNEYAYNILKVERQTAIVLLRNKRLLNFYQREKDHVIEYMDIPRKEGVEKAVKMIFLKGEWEANKMVMRQLIGEVQEA